jgi:hypothetical protein
MAGGWQAGPTEHAGHTFVGTLLQLLKVDGLLDDVQDGVGQLHGATDFEPSAWLRRAGASFAE